MNIRFEPCKGNIKDTDEVVVRALPMKAFWPVIKQVDLSGDQDWRVQAETVFYAVMNQMIEVNGQKLMPLELAKEPIDFFLNVLSISFPYLKDTILPQLLNLLSMDSVSQK